MPERYDLCIEAAADDVAVALAREGAVVRRIEWNGHQAQSVTLLPNIERLLGEAGADKSAISAVLVDIGPGGYAGLRVGVSVAKALAHALGVPIAGVGRLELDAWLVREAASGRRIIAAHRVVALAAVGRARLQAGRADDPTALVPLYLRGPAIGPRRADAGA